jgi:hypothetical protein
MSLTGGSSRVRRSSKRTSLNLEDAEEWEDLMLTRCENFLVHTTKWQDSTIRKEWKVDDDFYHFYNVSGLIGFSTHATLTYKELSMEFLATFKFTYQKCKPGKKGVVVPPSFDINFRMQGKRIIMSLEFFYDALHLPHTGSWEEVPMSSDEELAAFWASITVKIPDNFHRAKLNHIQHPGLRIFAAFLAR